MFSANTSQVAGAAALYVEDLFSVYTRTGTGASQTITTGIAADLVVTKGRSGATDWAWYDTARGATYDLVSNSTAAQSTQAQGLTAFGATGHTWDTLAKVNTNAATYVDFVFRKAPKFFDVVTYTGDGTSNRAISHSLGGTPGMVTVKATSTTGSWITRHTSATGELYLEQTAAQAASFTLITAMSASTFSVSGLANTSGVTYVAYLFAHDTASDGLIQCGSFTTDGSGNATVTLGWEPQYFLEKTSSVTSDWYIEDAMRGLPVISSGTSPSGVFLYANASNAEASINNSRPNATGFSVAGRPASTTYIYLAIRRGPMRQPTSGTQVYSGIARTGTGAAATVTGVGFAPDLVWTKVRNSTYGHRRTDRLRGAGWALFDDTTAETDNTTIGVTAFGMDGVSLGSGNPYNASAGSETYINHFFRRTPKVFDVVCDTGTGAAHAINHNLTVPPELMIRKGRSGATQWEVYSAAIANTEKLVLDSTAAKATDTTAWNSTTPTATTFTVGTGANVNTNAATYVTYLMASLAGVSKVGSYTGNGSSQTINCGFAAGARFALIKRTDSTGDWYVWDSTRGIVAANDPRLSLNTTAAEVTTDDSVDPDSSGFIVNQVAATNINVTAATYIFLAFT